MRILLVARSLGQGGAERQLVTLAGELARRGHDVAVALLYPGGPFAAELAAAGIPLHPLDKSGRWDLAGPLRRLRALVRAWRPEILHGYLPVANLLAALAGRAAPGCRVVFGIRASDMDLSRYDPANRLLYRAEAALAGRADLVIANAAAGLEALWRRGAPAGRGVVIANGIDTGRFRPDPAARAEQRARLGIDDATCLVGMIARHDPMKDHATFLAAAEACGPGFAFVLAGTGTADAPAPPPDGIALRRLGPVARVERLMAALDVGALPSRFGEGFPNALAEMMACGVPCVATPVGESAAILGDTGRIVPAGDPAALAEAWRALAPPRDPALAHRCRVRIEENYSVARLGARTEAALAALARPPIVHVITGLGTGGAEGMLARLARRSRAFRHVVVSLTGPGTIGPALRRDGVEVIALGLPPGPRALAGLPRLARLLRRLRPALVQTWLYHADLLGTLAAGLAGGLPVAWSLRCSDMDRARYGRLVGLLARLSPRPRLVIANAEAGRAWHRDQGYRPRAWAVIANGIDTDRFRPDPEARARWRAALGAGPETVLVGMVARVDPMKDHAGFLAAATAAAALRPEIALVVAGTGTETLPGPAAHRLGEVADVAGLYAALDIVVLASRFGEGFPNVVAEAMACGRPV
ncbi:MAG: hypothetical protein RLZZ501_1253, partial [Pseudomonadota bacterium]